MVQIRIHMYVITFIYIYSIIKKKKKKLKCIYNFNKIQQNINFEEIEKYSYIFKNNKYRNNIYIYIIFLIPLLNI